LSQVTLIRVGISAVLAAAVVLIAAWPLGGLRRLRRLSGEVINPDLPERYRSKAGTPTMGGIFILLGFAVGALAVGGIDVLGIVLVTLSFGAIGVLDDMLAQRRRRSLGLKARQKLLLQAIPAAAYVYWSMRTHHLLVVGWPGVWMVEVGGLYVLLGVLFILFMSNAVNLSDGMDGLAAGLTVLCGVPLAVLSSAAAGVASFSKGAPIAAAALSGACVGFLCLNAYPALVFMGDTGSLAIGACLAAVAISTGTEALLLVLGAVFAAELLSVVVQVVSFKTTGRRVFRMSPLHHHFDQCGWPEPQIVKMFWLAGAAASAICIVLAGITGGF
jgi:phospho-N-acetylmuramoyl-pentapeptide-transferase